MPRAYLSNVDAALLQLDDPTNPMMITGVMVLDSPIDYQRLKATLEVRLLGMARFRQRLAWSRWGTGRPHWQDDPGFDLDYHLQRARLGTSVSSDQVAMQQAVSLLASTPLDFSRPLWQFHLIENYGEGCAIVGRFHHAIADGVALVHVLLSLTDSDPDAPWPALPPAGPDQQESNRQGMLLQSARSRLDSTIQAVDTMRKGVGLLRHPSLLLDLGRLGGNALADLGRFLLLKPDPDTALRGELGGNKRVAWSAGVPLENIKAIQHALGGTVNDVLLTVVTGALRRYLEEQGEPVDSLSVRVTIPVNMRSSGREAELGNRVGAIFVSLPVSIADPVCRLGEIVRHVNVHKGSWEAPVFFGALSALGRAPAQITNKLVNTFGTRASVVMTNVMGPKEQLYLAGSPLAALMAWVPTTGSMGVGISVLSYAGEVRLGILTDEGLAPDPETIIAGFHAEFEALQDRISASQSSDH
jgi:diacylglycerol O-acyltransferase